MIKLVDQEQESVEGFGYINEDGYTEYVEVDDGPTAVVLHTYCGGDSTIYVSDIPNLIKALQAAYDYKQEK